MLFDYCMMNLVCGRAIVVSCTRHMWQVVTGICGMLQGLKRQVVGRMMGNANVSAWGTCGMLRAAGLGTTVYYDCSLLDNIAKKL